LKRNNNQPRFIKKLQIKMFKVIKKIKKNKTKLKIKMYHNSTSLKKRKITKISNLSKNKLSIQFHMLCAIMRNTLNFTIQILRYLNLFYGLKMRTI